ncbi:MAG: TonB-dependent receptor [Rhodospirillales bacterium]|nr:TonB-dependent receptor [Rhodospirillales bacterium]
MNSNIFLVSSGENFDLTEADQFEVGLKSVLLDGRAEATAAYYQIERDDVLERIGLDSATSVGGRESRGVELAASLQASEQWRIAANAAYTDAAFKRSANFDRFAGNTPPNVPEWTFNLWTSYRGIAGTPMEVGGALRFVSERFGDNANTVTLADYWIADGYAAWNGENYRVTARVTNLFDTDYVPWSDVFYLRQLDPGWPYANQLILGAPRTWELSLEYFF